MNGEETFCFFPECSSSVILIDINRKTKLYIINVSRVVKCGDHQSEGRARDPRLPKQAALTTLTAPSLQHYQRPKKYDILNQCWFNVVLRLRYVYDAGPASTEQRETTSQQTRYIDPTSARRWPTVFDGGPPLNYCCVNIFGSVFLDVRPTAGRGDSLMGAFRVCLQGSYIIYSSMLKSNPYHTI